MKIKKVIVSMLCVLSIGVLAACGGNEKAPTPEKDPVVSDSANEEADGAVNEEDILAFFDNDNIKMVMPFGSGGTSDTVGRKFAEVAGKYIKKPIVVENLTGGDGIVAASQFTQEKPDTKKIMFTSIGQFYAKNIKANIPFELTDLQPVTMLYKTDWILLTKADSDIQSFDDLIEKGKERTLKISVGGIGTDGHLTSGGLIKAAGANAEPVMYEGGAEQIAALLGGHVDACVANPSLGLQYVQAGDLIPIVSFGTEDYTGFEGITVPSVGTLGYPDSAIAGNGMLSVRAGSDESTAVALRVLAEKVFADEEWIKWTEETMTEQAQIFDEELMSFIDEQVVNAKAAADALGILENK